MTRLLHVRFWLPLLVAALLLGCKDGGGRSSPPPGPTVFADIQLEPYPKYTREDRVPIRGRAPQAESVRVFLPDRLLVVPVKADSFVVEVALLPDRINTIQLVAQRADGPPRAPLPVRIVHDSQPPTLFIESPAAGSQALVDVIDVAGRVRDSLSEADSLHVQVNGSDAHVSLGLGGGGTFFAPGVLLTQGNNQLVVVATDKAGNQTTRTVMVDYVGLLPNQPRLLAAGGDGQRGVAGRRLGAPLTVCVLDADGDPIADRLVTFRITRSNGVFIDLQTDVGLGRLAQVRTDVDGFARVGWQLGDDAGEGCQRAAAGVVGLAGPVEFCASAIDGGASQINVGAQDRQVTRTGAPAPAPLRVWVSDGCNGVAGTEVVFRVAQGDGRVGGYSEVRVATSASGHAEVEFLAGPTPGENVVTASFAGNLSEPVSFFIRAVAPDDSTTFEAQILDNASRPIQGALCQLAFPNGTELLASSGSDGAVRFSGIEAGPAHLHVEGQTATTVGNTVVTPGSFPSLGFELVLIAGHHNTLGRAVFLPRLDPANARSYSTTVDTELEVAGVEGLVMRIEAGSMWLDGLPALHGSPVSLNQVHSDEIPMSMPDGAAPPFAWTLQPGGATFSEPVTISYPNMLGLPPGALTNFLSFDHASQRFEIVATGTVSEDGALIESDPGAGIAIAGWGGNCPPYPLTGHIEKTQDPIGPPVPPGGLPPAPDSVPTPNPAPGPDFPDPESFAADFDLDIGPFEVPILDVAVPQISISAELEGMRSYEPCPEGNGQPVCHTTGSLNLQVAVQAGASVSLAGPALGKIEDYICRVVEGLAGDSVDCSVSAGFGFQSVVVDVVLSATQEPCTGTSGWAGRGQLSLQGVGTNLGVTGTVKILGVDYGLSSRLTLTDVVTVTLYANGLSLIPEISNSGPTISGSIGIVGTPLSINVSRQFSSLRGSFAGPSIPLPPPPGCE